MPLVAPKDDVRHLGMTHPVLVVGEEGAGAAVDVPMQAVLVHHAEKGVEVIPRAIREVFRRADKEILELLDGCPAAKQVDKRVQAPGIRLAMEEKSIQSLHHSHLVLQA